MIIRCPPLSSFFFGVGVGLGSGGGFGAGGDGDGDGGGGVGGSGSGSGVGPSFGNVSSTLLHVPCMSTAMARAVSPRCTPSMTPSSTAITHAVVWKRRGRERTRPIASFGVPRSLPHVHLQTPPRHTPRHPDAPAFGWGHGGRHTPTHPRGRRRSQLGETPPPSMFGSGSFHNRHNPVPGGPGRIRGRSPPLRGIERGREGENHPGGSKSPGRGTSTGLVAPSVLRPEFVPSVFVDLRSIRRGSGAPPSGGATPVPLLFGSVFPSPAVSPRFETGGDPLCRRTVTRGGWRVGAPTTLVCGLAQRNPPPLRGSPCCSCSRHPPDSDCSRCWTKGRSERKR